MIMARDIMEAYCIHLRKQNLLCFFIDKLISQNYKIISHRKKFLLCFSELMI